MCVIITFCRHKAKTLQLSDDPTSLAQLSGARRGGGGGGGGRGRGAKSSQAALAVAELQDELPMARVVYCSATGGYHVRHYSYCSRLGLWGPNSTPVGSF